MSAISIERSVHDVEEVPDGLLVRGHLDGEDGAFEVLYRRYNDRLVGWFVRRVNDRVLAEDLAQDTMVRVLKYADSFEQDRPMWPWLKTTAYRVMVNHLESRPEGRESFEDQYQDEGEFDPLLASVEERPALERVLGGLSERHRVALSLRYVQGWAPEDVADFLDMGTNACNQLMYRARNAARREYERVCGEVRAIVAPIFGGAFARVRSAGARVRQMADTIGFGSLTAAAETLGQLAIGIILTTVGASGALVADASPSTSGARLAQTSVGLAALRGTPQSAPQAVLADVSAPAPAARAGRTASPARSRRGVAVGTSSDELDAGLPASMTANASSSSDDRVSVNGRVFAYVPSFEDEDPISAGTGHEWHCDPSSPVFYSTVCAGLDVLEEVAPPPDS